MRHIRVEVHHHLQHKRDIVGLRLHTCSKSGFMLENTQSGFCANILTFYALTFISIIVVTLSQGQEKFCLYLFNQSDSMGSF